MMRKMALSLLLVPGLIGAQGIVKVQEDRTKTLDALGKTPFFSKPGADAVRRVVNGGNAHKEDEKVLEPAQPQPGATPFMAVGHGGQGMPNLQPIARSPGQVQAPSPQGGQSPQSPAPQAPPAPDPVFSWRLVGISYGRQQGMALFQSGAKSLSVQNGAVLDPETKVVSVSPSHVVLDFHGKRLDLTPW